MTRPAHAAAPAPSADDGAGDGDGDARDSRNAGDAVGGDANAGGDDDSAATGSDPRDSAASPGRAGATYKIRSGDTLWNVSQSFLRDPNGWPKLWARNPKITNPHWIYPGQVVRLRDEDDDGEAEAQAPGGNPAASVSVSAEPRPLLTTSRSGTRSGRPRPEPSLLRPLAFVDEGTLKASGTVNGSIEEKIMLATGDQAYVEFPAGHVPQVGARFSVYRVDDEQPLRSPGSTAVLGYMVHVFGEVVIDDVTGRNIASGHLVGLVEPVERGYRVGAVIQQRRALVERRNAVNATARIVASVDPTSFVANQMFVILDRGRRHGVEAGNRFLVLRQGDGLKRMLETWDATDPRFPPYAVAEIVAVDVQNQTTVGWIARGSREIRVGDVADLRRGY